MLEGWNVQCQMVTDVAADYTVGDDIVLFEVVFSCHVTIIIFLCFVFI